MKVEARVKVWLEAGGHYVFGFGLSEILKAVEDTGSIKEAARRLGKSYRHIWSRIKKTEEALGQSLVQTHVGGRGLRRSGLTPSARTLVADFDALRRRIIETAEGEFGCRMIE